MLISNHSRSFN